MLLHIGGMHPKPLTVNILSVELSCKVIFKTKISFWIFETYFKSLYTLSKNEYLRKNFQLNRRKLYIFTR